MNCWAAVLGGCSDKSSREHLVSAGLWTGDHVDVLGFPWCKESPKRVGVSSLTGKVLCREHNSLLSDTDGAGKAAFDAFRGADQLAHKRANERPYRRWRIHRFDVSGCDLERWFLKTTINLAISQKSSLLWHATGNAVHLVPLEFAEVAFGRRELAQPMGLYFVALVGQKVVAGETIEFAPLSLHSQYLVGGIFTFRGVRFLLYLGTADLPSQLDLPGTRMAGWEDGRPYFRVPRHRWKIGRSISHYIDFGWHRTPTGGKTTIGRRTPVR